MFTIKAFKRDCFQHLGYEAIRYEVDEEEGVVLFQERENADWPSLSLKNYGRIVIENSSGKTVENLWKGEGS